MKLKTEMAWENNAHKVKNDYGGFVDWEERFYNCPFCGEPVYDDDWADDELEIYLCPICEDIDADDDNQYLPHEISY